MLATKRMLREAEEMRADTSLAASGIWVLPDTQDIFRVRAVIIGPKGTPYAGGFFCFELRADPNLYPNKPPSGKFLTTDGRVRFNPNLYACGKICLSLLGTWSGPPWTPICRMSSVLVSILGCVLTPEPLRNEPGYERTQQPKVEAYSAYVAYHTWRYAILHTLQRGLPSGFEALNDRMRAHVRANAAEYAANLQGLAQNSPRSGTCQYAGHGERFDWDALLDTWVKFVNKI